MEMRLLLKFVLPCLFTVLWAEASAYSLKSKSLAGIIDLKTWLISIGKTSGKKITDEEPFASCKYQHAVLDGKQYYHLTKSFQSPGHCAGHYRCVSTNYRGRQASFFQNNTKVVIPFYLAGQTCDVSWDNYSLAKRGDSRLSNPLFELILFSERRKAGWLQAFHRNDQSKNAMVPIKGAETGEKMNCSWFETDVFGNVYSGKKKKYYMKEKLLLKI